ncbi:MAG: hypothetical protein ACFFFB_13575 [Candidatus Heimdallarchaeota archaeon]
MKKICHKCGMIRSTKDLVYLEEGKYLCFSCWNEIIKENEETLKKNK